MERLTESKIKSLKESMKSNLNFYFYNDVMKVFDELLEYRHLEEQGLPLKLPCKVGYEVWEICRSLTFGEVGDEAEVWYRIERRNFTLSMLGYFGKTVFLTKEEAEKALAEMKGE